MSGLSTCGESNSIEAGNFPEKRKTKSNKKALRFATARIFASNSQARAWNSLKRAESITRRQAASLITGKPVP